MKSFVTEYELESLAKYLVGGVTPLGASNPEITESSLLDKFNNYSYSITITLKGANKIRALEGNLQKQYNLFKKIISTIIDENTSDYLFYFEIHRCGMWLHSHGVINTDPKKILKIKREIFQLIEGEKIQKYQSYSRRIDTKKVDTINNWLPYIRKDEESMLSLDSTIKKIYKIS